VRFRRDGPYSTQAAELFTGLFGNTFGGLDHYWRQVSYQRIGLTGTCTFGWFTLPEPRFAYFVDQDLDGYAEFDLSPPYFTLVPSFVPKGEARPAATSRAANLR